MDQWMGDGSMALIETATRLYVFPAVASTLTPITLGGKNKIISKPTGEKLLGDILPPTRRPEQSP